MTLNQIAYTQGRRAALEKFAAIPGMGGAPQMPAAGGLNAVPPIGVTVPGTPAATMKPGAPNQALPTSPVLSTGVPGIPTVAGMGKTQTQGATISAPPTAAPMNPAVAGSAKLGSVYAPTKPPRTGFTRTNTQHSTVGSNNTTETAKSTSSAPVTSAANTASVSSSSSPAAGGASSTGQAFGGIVPSTGTTPAASLANETASNFRNQVVATSGGGK